MTSAEQEMFGVAVHEVGHQTVTTELGHSAQAFVGGTTNGVCWLDGDIPCLHRAAIGWGGILAEHILDARPAWRKLPNVVRPTPETLGEWFGQMRAIGMDQLSGGDRALILYSSGMKPVALAFRILWPRQDCVRAESKLLLSESRSRLDHSWQLCEVEIKMFASERQAEALAAHSAQLAQSIADLVPTPSVHNFDSFMRAVVTDAEAGRQWSLFLMDQDRAAGDQTLNFFRAYVSTLEGWESLYREFRQWRKTNGEAAA